LVKALVMVVSIMVLSDGAKLFHAVVPFNPSQAFGYKISVMFQNDNV